MDFIPPSLWSPNSPDLNPADYAVWWMMQNHVCKNQIKDVEELRQRVEAEWDSLDQRVIDSAFRDWRKRLRAALQLTEDILNMHCEHECFASSINASRLIDYYGGILCSVLYSV